MSFLQYHQTTQINQRYRLDQLPDDFDDKMRVTLERMMIRSLASLLQNNTGVESMGISDFVLTNKRIDK